jgi:putative hemolysin
MSKLKYLLPVLLIATVILTGCEMGGVTLTTPAVYCEVEGESYQPGETVPSVDCNECVCDLGGAVACTEIACEGLANPAAVKCSVDGHKYEIRATEEGGQDGFCVDEAGKECLGWEYSRGTCLLGDVTQKFEAELKDVTGATASGTAVAELSADAYTHSVSAKNLPALEEGFFYEGWLVQIEPLDVLSAGKMVPEGDPSTSSGQEKGSFALALETPEDLTSYTRVVITLEPDDGDPEPAEHVLEGTLEPQTTQIE